MFLLLVLALIPSAGHAGQAAAESPRIVVQTGHTGEVRAVAFSPDARLLASGGTDRMVKLWDMASGRELRVLAGHEDSVAAVAFSPDGRLLASAEGTTGFSDPDDEPLPGAVKIWDVATGACLHTLPVPGAGATTVAFSPDGKWLASADSGGTAYVWNASDFRPVTTLATGESGWATVAFGAGSGTLACGIGQTVTIWRPGDWRPVHALRDEHPETNSIAFSRDGRLLVRVTKQETVHLWDAVSGRRLQDVPSADVYSAVFLDAETLLTGTSGGLPGDGSASAPRIAAWNATNGRNLSALEWRWSDDFPHDYSTVLCLAASADATLVAGAIADSTIRVWDVKSRKEIRHLKRRSSEVAWAAFAPDGRGLAVGSSGDGTIRIWRTNSGREVETIRTEYPVHSLDFNRDGTRIVTGSARGGVVLRNVETGRDVWTAKQKADFPPPPPPGGASQPPDDGTIGAGTVYTADFSPTGDFVASGGWIGYVSLWNAATGREARRLPDIATPDGSPFVNVYSVAFSPDGKRLASADDSASVRIWDVNTGRELASFKAGDHLATSVAWSPDGQMLAAGGKIGHVGIWDPATARLIRELPVAEKHAATTVAFSPDGRFLAAGATDAKLRLWETAGWRLTAELPGHANEVSSVAWSPDSRLIVTTSADKQTKLWDAGEARELASLIAIDRDDWLAVTPDGLFDGTPGAIDAILWRFGGGTTDVAPVEAYFNEFYRPGLLTDLLAGARPRAAKDLAGVDRRQAVLSVTSLEGSRREREVPVRIAIESAPAGARDVRLFRNGSLVKIWRGDVALDGQGRVVLETAVPIVAGENTFTAYAFNRDNVKSRDASVTVSGAPSLRRAGTTWVIAIGVDRYANPNFNLRYAVADANAFAASLRGRVGAGSLPANVRVAALLDRDATRERILATLGMLAGKSKSPGPPSSRAFGPAGPEDAVVIYFAGHGLAYDNHFHMIPHDIAYDGARRRTDDADVERILERAISDDDVERALEPVDAGLFLLVIDACNSGKLLDAAEARRGPMNSRGLAHLAYEKGMYILAAAQSYQAALEARKLGHGYLTYALVREGLAAGAADFDPRDGVIHLREWLDFAVRRVPEMQRAKLAEGRGLELSTSFVEGEERILDHTLKTVQRPRAYYRRETGGRRPVLYRQRARR